MKKLDVVKEELMKVIEKELQDYTDAVYRSGHEDGVKSVQLLGNRARDIGREEAWECVRKMWRMDYDDLESIFDSDDMDWILENFTASEAMQKIKDYEERKVEKCGKCLISYNGANCSSCEEVRQTDEFYGDCNYCKYWSRTTEQYPCNECKHQYISKWEKGEP